MEQRYPFELESMYAENPLMATIKLARFKFVSKMLDKRDIVLDLGCGNGISTHYYSYYCDHVIGVDIQEAVKDSWDKNENTKIQFLRKDILTDAPYNLDSFSVITCVDVIEHFSKDDGERILQLSSSALKRSEGGIMIIGSPSVHSQPFRASHNKLHHIHEYDPDELQQLCGKYFSRTFQFSMNDELVHTGFNKLSWFFFIVCVV